MNVEQTNQLLMRVQAIDNRPIGDSTLVAWHELVGDLDYGMAVEAVWLHRRESTAYLTPAHVRANVERMLLASLGAREDEYGNTVEPDQTALAAYRRAASTRGEIER